MAKCSENALKLKAFVRKRQCYNKIENHRREKVVAASVNKFRTHQYHQIEKYE